MLLLVVHFENPLGFLIEIIMSFSIKRVLFLMFPLFFFNLTFLSGDSRKKGTLIANKKHQIQYLYVYKTHIKLLLIINRFI